MPDTVWPYLQRKGKNGKLFSWDRCHDFKNISAEKFGKKWRLLLKTMLHYAKN
jgi:hypothetical protein